MLDRANLLPHASEMNQCKQAKKIQMFHFNECVEKELFLSFQQSLIKTSDVLFTNKDKRKKVTFKAARHLIFFFVR